MSLEPKPPAIHEIADPEQRLAAFFKWAADYCAEQRARNPTPDRPREPWVDKPGTLIAAEKDLRCAEMNHLLWSRMCETTDRCEDRHCRRSKRCRGIVTAAETVEAARATLAAERAKWQPPPPPAEPPRGRKKGRTAVRP
jgi:hypothetical protein